MNNMYIYIYILNSDRKLKCGVCKNIINDLVFFIFDQVHIGLMEQICYLNL